MGQHGPVDAMHVNSVGASPIACAGCGNIGLLHCNQVMLCIGLKDDLLHCTTNRQVTRLCILYRN